MAKKVIAVLLILLTGGAWIYLDYLNRQEKAAAEELRREIEKAHARAVTKGRYESEIYNELAGCRDAAKQANHDFISLHETPVPGKPGVVTPPPREIMHEGVRMLEAAYVECQHTYDARLKASTQQAQLAAQPVPAVLQPVH